MRVIAAYLLLGYYNPASRHLLHRRTGSGLLPRIIRADGNIIGVLMPREPAYIEGMVAALCGRSACCDPFIG